MKDNKEVTAKKKIKDKQFLSPSVKGRNQKPFPLR